MRSVGVTIVSCLIAVRCVYRFAYNEGKETYSYGVCVVLAIILHVCEHDVCTADKLCRKGGIVRVVKVSYVLMLFQKHCDYQTFIKYTRQHTPF